MGDRTQGLMHYNPDLSHQVEHARAFEACGFEITPSAFGTCHTHVISGPWFAYDQWLSHGRVLMIDRAWFGDPDKVALAWLMPDGSKRYASGDKPRPCPPWLPWKTREQSALILADYGQDVSELEQKARQRFSYVNVRYHPAEKPSNFTLGAEIMLADVCIGHKTTALFDAVRLGVPIICTDPKNECMPVGVGGFSDELFRGDISGWMHEMSYKQFSLHEIETGIAWELLNDENLNEICYANY